MKAPVAMSSRAAFLAHANLALRCLVLTVGYGTWLPIACGRATAAVLGTTLSSNEVAHVWTGCVTIVVLLRSYLVW